MSIVSLVLVIAVAGFFTFVIMQIPMPPIFKNIIYAVVALALVLWVLQSLGFHTGFARLRF